MTHLGDLLSAFLDDELVPTERAAAESHLAECVDCRGELSVAEESRQLVRSLPMLEPPPEVFQLPAEVVPLRRPRLRRMVAAVAATATLIVGVGFGVSAERAVPLPLDAAVEQHVARASVDPGFNVLQVQAVVSP